MSQTSLIKYEHQIDLARLYRYYNLKARMEHERSRYFKLYQKVMELAALYLDELPESQTIIRLRREIRLATKGTPQTIAEDAITSAGYVSSGTEQLFNAQSHLVKNAYRMVAPLVHPDRGGDVEMFQLVNSAYRLRDLTFLQETYIMLVKDNVFWRCSDEAEYYMKQEIERPKVSLGMFQNKPEFEIVRLHQSGKREEAKAYASRLAQTLIYMLQTELNHLLNPNAMEHNNGNDKESNEESWSEDRPNEEGEDDGYQEYLS